MPLVVLVLGLMGLCALPGLWGVIRGTTLVAPWCWALFSGLAMLVGATLGSVEPLVSYSVSCTTLLPAAAVYGAKRPQDRGWQWIVAALLVMLLWPAGESWLLEQRFDLTAQPLRSWFLVILLVVQCGNWIVTRNSGAVVLLTVAQVMLFWQQLPWGDRQTGATVWYCGAILLAGVPWWLQYNLRQAILLPARSPAETDFPSPRELAEWAFFRMAYGVVWALRVTERINEVAALRRWPWRWGWSGPVPYEDELAGAHPALADGSHASERVYWRQLWTNVFRRFLNPVSLPDADNAATLNETEDISRS